MLGFDGPVILTIKTGVIKKKDIPGIDEVIDRISCLKGRNSYTKEAIQHMRNKVDQGDVAYISFEDFNTRGLKVAFNGQSDSSEDTWAIYAYNKGVHSEEEDKTGQHGLSQPIKLLVIMMNPGESEPESSSYQIPYFSRERVANGEHCLSTIPTNPDRTQYQVMRMMNGLGIKHCRVINISDIRNTQSGSLAGDLLSLVSDFHSMFSRDRQQELQNIYSSLVDDAFIFLAWGRDIIDCEPFKLLAERCFSTLPQNKVVLGIPGEDDLKVQASLAKGTRWKSAQMVEGS